MRNKALTINDDEQAKRKLSQIGYFSLIGSYKHPFKDKTTKKYRNNVTFDDIVMLYTLDMDLRNLFLKHLLIIERSVKSQMAYVFCDKHGASQTAYLDPQNYSNAPAKNQTIQNLIKVLRPLAEEPTYYPYINHHQTVHHNVPLWVLINAVTFGSMSKMFGVLPQNLQSRIAREYPLNIKELDQILSVLTKYRNACAHGERLFSYQTKDDIPDLALHKKLKLPQKGQQYRYGKHDLFAVVIAFRYMLPWDTFIMFKKELSKLLDDFSSRCNSLPYSKLLDEMGFPPNWKNITKKYKL